MTASDFSESLLYALQKPGSRSTVSA
jgi:hypothetical protein